MRFKFVFVEPIKMPERRLEDGVLRPPPPIMRDRNHNHQQSSHYGYDGYDEDAMGEVNSSYV
jgi:hypothetical protein